MKLSTKGKYGIIAMTDLAIAYDKNKEYMVLKSIAKNKNISEAYLEKLISMLKKADLVITQRGATGGYRLSKSPKEIKLKEILEALEGSLNVGGCNKDNNCDRFSTCVSQVVCERINDKINEVLVEITLLDLKNIYEEKIKEE